MASRTTIIIRRSRSCCALLVAIVAVLATNGRSDVASMISQQNFDSFLNRNNDGGDCDSHGFYTYEAFITAANYKAGFGSTEYELAAFFANVAHETGEGCYVRQLTGSRDASDGEYYGRGPLQLTHDYNYEAAGNDIGVDLVSNPDMVATDPVVSFKTAVWFWMTQPTSSSCPHVCMVSTTDPADFSCTIRAINPTFECGSHAYDPEPQDRIDLYQNFCSQLGLAPPTGYLYCT